jgi:hypothetical protein
VTISRLEMAIIAKKEETMTGQVKRQCFSTHMELFTWNSSQKE